MALRAPWGQMQGSATTAMREHRRGAMTQQMAPRRRNPKGGRHFAGARWRVMRVRVATVWNGRRLQSGGSDTPRPPQPFFSSLLAEESMLHLALTTLLAFQNASASPGINEAPPPDQPGQSEPSEPTPTPAPRKAPTPPPTPTPTPA